MIIVREARVEAGTACGASFIQCINKQKVNSQVKVQARVKPRVVQQRQSNAKSTTEARSTKTSGRNTGEMAQGVRPGKEREEHTDFNTQGR